MTDRGIVIRSQSGFFTILKDGEEITTTLRGRLKQGPKEGDLVAIGDRVQFSRQEDGSGTIEEVEERGKQLSRLAPAPGGGYEQVIVANPDQAVFVFACAKPAPNMRMLDRFLVIAEQQELPAVIVANKTDLVKWREPQRLFGHYPNIGYPVLYTSAREKRGLRKLRRNLKEKLSVLVGPSGAGKSSLLNALQPGLGLEVSAVSKATKKGTHTTVVRELFPLKEGGYVADTPGLKALGLWDIEPEELDGYFREMRALVADCQYNNCTHLEEPGCAILEAVDKGKIHPARYDSYIRLRSSKG